MAGMTNHSGEPIFSQTDLQQAARQILDNHPNSIVTWRLLKEVLRIPTDDAELVRVRREAQTHPWVSQLEQSQLPDGSWGRFHTQDNKQKTVFRTTEEAIDRGMALGLDPSEGVLFRARKYILDVLAGKARITDRDEKNEAWALGIKLILAGRLAQLDPTEQAIEPYWTYLEEVTKQAFTSGDYCLENEEAAYQHLSGIHWAGGFLESQHALRILSVHKMTQELERSLVNWIWNKPDGIRYLRAPLSNFHPRQIGYWLRSMGILSHFAAWHEISLDTLNKFWLLRNEDGFWDFGSQIARSVDFPLSENWRKTINRKHDYSTCLLVLLRKYFD